MVELKVMKCFAGRSFESTFISVLFLIASSFLVTGCLDQGSGSEGNTQVVADPEVVPSPLPPLTTPERTVCDPFNAGASAQDRGLVGNLVYLTDDQPRYSDVFDYIDNGTPIQSTLYFDQLFVPTRAFDLGFYTQDGQLVTNQNDDPIYEYFGLRLESQLTLADNEPEGWYQMAILSDDGAVLSEKLPDDSLDIIVDNNGNHPTRMGCASKAIYMDHDTKKSVVINYHQGPRYHIALSVLWRPVPAGDDPMGSVNEIECGRQGNGRYFDSTKVPSEPTQVYYDMLTRGWKPLTNENYYFPVQASNPCAVAQPLLVTNFSILSTNRTQVSVSWNTSLPANSQVEVRDIVTGAVIQSPLDPALNMNHGVTLSGLSPNTLYSIKAISQSADGQLVESAESAFRTPR